MFYSGVLCALLCLMALISKTFLQLDRVDVTFPQVATVDAAKVKSMQ